MIVIKSKKIKKINDGSNRGQAEDWIICCAIIPPFKKNTKRCGCKSNPAKPISGRPRMTG